MNKIIIIAITVGIVFLCVITSILTCVSAQNKANRLEENIYEQKSALDVQYKRRFDLITKLVDIVEAESEYEKELLTSVTEMRSLAGQGKAEEVMVMLNAVMEAYPQLQATESYVELMNEMSITENMIKEQRLTYNSMVKAYRTYTRNQPGKVLLSIQGYDIVDFEYLEYAESEVEMPDELFE